jgi:predicted metal-dependent hydrolase
MTHETTKHVLAALDQLRAFMHMNRNKLTRPAGYYAVTCAIDHLACVLSEAVVPGEDNR